MHGCVCVSSVCICESQLTTVMHLLGLGKHGSVRAAGVYVGVLPAGTGKQPL